MRGGRDVGEVGQRGGADARWHRPGKARGGGLDAVGGGSDDCVGVARSGGPHRRDQEQFVGEPVENQHDAGAHDHHIGQAQPSAGCARQALDEAGGFIREKADEHRECLGQVSGHVEPAFGHQRAQGGERGLFTGRESIGGSGASCG